MKSLKEKTLFLEQVEKIPIIQVVCEKTNISRATYYRWIKTNPKFKKQIIKATNNGISLMNDVAESKLLSAVKDGHMTAIIFWLKNNNPRYSDKKINLSIKERQELIEAIVSSDPQYAYKLLTEKTIQGKIPRFFANTINSMITKSMKVNQSKLDFKKAEILQKIKSL